MQGIALTLLAKLYFSVGTNSEVELNESYSSVVELGRLKFKLHLRLRRTQRFVQEFL